jgi:hypothetical protein
VLPAAKSSGVMIKLAREKYSAVTKIASKKCIRLLSLIMGVCFVPVVRE